jgi:hypothetical protein
MAVLTKLLSGEDWKTLTSLSTGRLRILAFPSSVEFGNRRLALHDSEWRRVGVKADYEGVEFKFECFFLRMLEPHEAGEAAELLASIDCDSIATVERTEWTRTARPGEVPSGHETIVQRRGRSSHRPPDCLSSCTATVGILFLHRDHEVGLLAISDDDPITLSFTTHNEKIVGYLAECDVNKPSALRS